MEEELFNFENELFRNMDDDSQEAGPVICLGREFKNDEERKAYYRDELRKKLPELRNMEGFPIGEDEDIIALSDPPYYTACPNPWIDDLIQEWERKKSELEKQGIRKSDFEVKEPYASDVSEGKNNPIYTVHTYHTKVPHPAIMRYILYYTQPGDIVMDGFAGTGMTGLAAQACSDCTPAFSQKIEEEWKVRTGKVPTWGERHAICGDLSPYATNIAHFYNSPLDAAAFKKEAERIYSQMEKDCGWLYEVRDENGNIEGKLNFAVWSDVFVCPHCGEEYVFWDAAVDYKNKCILDKFPCPHCHAEQNKKTAKVAMESYYDEGLGMVWKRVKSKPVIIVYLNGSKQIERKPNKYDIELLKKIDEYPIQDIYPINELPEGFNTGQPKQSKNIYWVHQFFTKRNLIAISHLYRIIGESQMSMQFRFLFTGLLLRSTKMNRVHINNYFFGGGGWNAGFLKGTLYIPNSPIETSVLSQIQDKVAAILRAAQFLPKSYGNVQYVGSASKLNISDNSIDYIFTDPPFGSNINYSELNFLPEAWLRVTTDNATEAIDNVAQGKDKDFYRREMQICFAEYYRVLKPDKWITIEFSNTNAGIWNSIQQALTKAGFIIANVAALNKGQGGIRSITSTTAVKQDLAISCYKPSIIITDTARLSCDNNLWKFVEEHLNHLAPYIINNGKLEEVRERDARIIYDRLISYFVQKGISVPVNAQEFQQGLRERFIERDGMFFTISQAMEYDEKKRQGIEFVPMGIIIGCEADGIAWLRNRLERKPQTYQELQPEWLHDLVSTKKGDSMPEMMQILDENFLKNDKDQWYVPDVNNQTDLEAMRTKKLLREFSLYVEAKKVKTARLEALKAGFKNCYQNKDFATIIAVGNKIPESLLMEDETLLQYYDIASSRVS